jgi:hypothetical protein
MFELRKQHGLQLNNLPTQLYKQCPRYIGGILFYAG